MIKSMTGFGRNISNYKDRKYTVEIKTVNHRYNDISIRQPRYLICLEDKIRQIISKNISRGKIDVFVTIENLSDSNNIKIDESLAGTYISEMRNLISKYNLNTDITATSVLRLPDIIINSNEIDEEVYFKELSECTNKAIETLNKTRAIEGENLKTDILKRLDIILDKVILIEPKSKNLVNEYKEKLNSRLNEIGAKGIIDDSRLGAELVLFADKSSIEEEITRLKSHITTFKQFLNQEDDLPIGKKLDFLSQEMNREINTIGSKANCIDITNEVVLIKNEIENIREQVQNIE